jgi:hypothetical protein
MDMKQCENATAVNVNKFMHGYHYVHLNNSFIIDVISKVTSSWFISVLCISTLDQMRFKSKKTRHFIPQPERTSKLEHPRSRLSRS